jgi:hypothetical protein
MSTNSAGTHPWRVCAPMILCAAPLGASLLVPVVAEACATCGCTLSSDAALGFGVMPGWRLSLEYDYINQDELRSGTRAVNTVPDGTELEHDTLNQYITAGVSYAPNFDWSFQLFVPYVVRSHSTYGTYESSEPLPDLSYANFSKLGDLRLIANYQGFLSSGELGVQAGVKLPTGEYGTAIDFRSGPLAGQPLDASLQPGTGSTDVIVGAYYQHPVSKNLELFASGQFQAAFRERMDQPGNNYRPGNSTTAIVGLRYEAEPRWVPQLQLNLLHKAPDEGALADVQNTAGTVLYVSPGISLHVAHKLIAFGFVQLPVYSNLYGYQLFPHYSASVGLSYAP